MYKVILDHTDIQNPRYIPIKKPIYGVRISSDSEVDQCGISILTQVGTFAGKSPRNARRNVASGFTKPESFIAETVHHKVSVRRPFVGFIPPGELGIYASRFINASTYDSSLNAFRVHLDLLTEPWETAWMPTERAPFDADIEHYESNAAGTAQQFAFPTMGRRYHTLELKPGDGGSGTTATMIGVRFTYDQENDLGQTIQVATLIPSTTLTSILAYEGSGDYDMMLLTIDHGTANPSRTYGHFRSED